MAHTKSLDDCSIQDMAEAAPLSLYATPVCRQAVVPGMRARHEATSPRVPYEARSTAPLQHIEKRVSSE
uniref:hypothetical protein n=1 Tax=Cupriavidus yeoncheonensis TaxID=1462994 RepID=UPI003F494B93